MFATVGFDLFFLLVVWYLEVNLKIVVIDNKEATEIINARCG